MFPGDSDPLNWGTEGVTVPDWSEVTEGNTPEDRRFCQAAGPFILKPGAVNNLTVGVVFGRSFDGDVEASVRAMKRADTKAQSLFDACFEIVEPPRAPVLSIQEMENELILFLSNPPGPDNLEDFEAKDEVNIATAEHAREREQLQLNAERAKTRLVKKTQQQIARESKITHSKANFKVGAVFSGAIGFGALMLLTELITLGLLTMSTAGGALGGYLWRATKGNSRQIPYDVKSTIDGSVKVIKEK